MINYLKRKNAPNLAYVKHEGSHKLPTIMFLGGFRSDMQGTKALYLEGRCKERQQSFIRFDYRGHGQSGGEFKEACISDWAQDAADILIHCVSGPTILVGSSMGGWIAFLLALKYPKYVQVIVGLAAAPDFTTWIEKEMSDDQKSALDHEGHFELPNEYEKTPYIITKKLIENGRQNVLLDKRIDINVPVRLIQGKQDADVSWQTAERIKQAIVSDDVQITYIDDADHRLSSLDQLEVIDRTIESIAKQ